jgi:predicted RNase H-like HicB family nuclease
MVSTKPFLYLGVLNFTLETPSNNSLFRVSKSRNGDPRQREAKIDRGKTVRNQIPERSCRSRSFRKRWERDAPARNNKALGLPAFAIQTGGSFTVPLGQVNLTVKLITQCGVSNMNRTKQITLTASVWREDDVFVAQCIEYDVASYGDTEEEAVASLAEAVKLHLEPPVATITPRLRHFEIDALAA